MIGGHGVIATLVYISNTTYTGYNGTASASGQITLTLPVGSYRFRAYKGGMQYWSGPSNHCAVPGCTAATVTITGQAQAMPGNPLASRSPLVEPAALLMAPLIVGAVFGRRRKGKYLAWPVAGVLLAVALVGLGTALSVSPAEALAPSPAEALAALASGEARIAQPARELMPASSPAANV